MTTLAADTYRVIEVGERNNIPVIASDIIYEGSAVGTVGASGHARPLSAAANERFAGFSMQKADNSSGSAADINVEVMTSGKVQLSVTGAVITDVGQPVYATDDNAFQFSPVSALYIGRVKRFVSSGVVIVGFDAINDTDPWEGYTKELKSDDYTLDANDNGKLIGIATDAKVFTLPATVIGYKYTIINLGAYGTVAVNVSPNASDKIMGHDDAGADNKDQINTKATACRGDFIELLADGVNGWFIQRRKGVWAQEA